MAKRFDIIDEIVTANRILANEGIVDSFGHVSVRDPRNPRRFVMARSRSPELVELDDLMEFELDGTPVDLRGRTAYGERMIHGALYEARAATTPLATQHLLDEAKKTKPLSVVMAEKIAWLRAWAQGRTVPADCRCAADGALLPRSRTPGASGTFRFRTTGSR